MRLSPFSGFKQQPDYLGFSKVFFALFVLVSLATQGIYDPTPSNPVWPLGGIKNWLGIIGALVSGGLFDIFGETAYLIPLVLIFLQYKRKAPVLIVILYELVVFSSLSLLLALILPTTEEVIFFTGLWGYSGYSILGIFPGKTLSVILLLIFSFRVGKHVTVDVVLIDAILYWYHILISLIFRQKFRSILMTTKNSISSVVNTLFGSFSSLFPVAKTEKDSKAGKAGKKTVKQQKEASLNKRNIFYQALKEYTQGSDVDQSIGGNNESKLAETDLDKIFNEILEKEKESD